METVLHSPFRRRLLVSALPVVAGAAAVAALSPGGLGRPEPVHVTGGASAAAYRRLTGLLADAPSWTGTVLEAVTEGTLIALGLLLGWLGWIALRRGDARGLAGTVLVGCATMAAYGASEALKLVVDEERPCRAVRQAMALAHCPEAGDWAFPSNHATLAAGLAAGLAVLRPRLAAVTLPAAGLVALGRVAVGVHYPHDVLAGAFLGAAVAFACVLLLLAPAARVVALLRVGRRQGDAGFMGHDGRGGAVVDTQAGQDRADVGFDGALREVQPAGDPAVGQSTAEEGQHVAFPNGERVGPLPRGGPAAGRGARAAGREVRHDPRRDPR
ncbi:hypothetical protein GCM10010361_53680 [Streptomyces olivaceiscleroticus]|uniref:Phosphatidic acid phosphatase type 2/haloperoxidase domain-containing protein n=1 Tax=Streptomyces olivaceiscleroticus TaxID=68245 RepID=A0ABN1AQZ7_9ACTN